MWTALIQFRGIVKLRRILHVVNNHQFHRYCIETVINLFLPEFVLK
jgi:hypothetical protein